MSEFGSYRTARAWIAETNEVQEARGLPVMSYRVIPIRNVPGGRDIR